MTTQGDGAASPGAPEAGGPELALQRFVAVQRIHALYPPRNPKVLMAIQSLREALAGFAADRPLELQVGREHIAHADIPLLAGQREVSELARKLYLASITMVSLSAVVTDADMLSFLELLRLSDAQRRELGSVADELRRRAVAGIVVREAGHVSIEEAADGSDPWDLTSLEELEALELAILGETRSDGFHESFQAVADGQNPKAGRLLGLLAKPAQFATLLLDTASQHKPGGKVDLDAQLAFMIDLIARLEPMVESVTAADKARLYARLAEVSTTLERSIYRELLDAGTPPYIRLGAIARLFPSRIRALTVKEALGLGLGPGLMPFIMGALRQIAAGDQNLLGFLDGATAPPVIRAGPYRPPPLPPAPAEPPPLTPAFFERAPGGAPDPGEVNLASAVTQADSTLDSIDTLTDLLLVEPDAGHYGKLLTQLVERYRGAIATASYGPAMAVVRVIHEEWSRQAPKEGESMSMPATALAAAFESCGSKESMTQLVKGLASLTEPAAIQGAARAVLGLTRTAAISLLDLLAEEPKKETRLKLVDVLDVMGRQHIDAIASYGTHAHWYVVRNVICILARWGPELVPHVVQVAQHSEARVRKEAIKALAQYRTPAAIQGYARFVQDSDDGVAREAIKTLVDQRERDGLPFLHDELRSPDLGKRHPATLAALVRALGLLGDDSSRQLLLTISEAGGAEGWLKAGRLRTLFDEAATEIDRRLTQRGA